MLRKIFNRLLSPILLWCIKTMEHFYYVQFTHYPFAEKPMGSRNEYLEIWNNAKKVEYPVIKEYESETGWIIDPEWLHELALVTQVVKKHSSICYQHGRLLYSRIREYLERNSDDNITIMETGTARGFSALCMAKALSDAGRMGKIITFDILPNDRPIYWNCIRDNEGLHTRMQLLENYRQFVEQYIIFVQGNTELMLEKVDMPRVHFAFIDGCHTYQAVLREFRHVKAKQAVGDAIFFDDYTQKQFPGVVMAIDEICAVHKYSMRKVIIDSSRGYVIATKV